jgi:hypothetical protein
VVAIERGERYRILGRSGTRWLLIELVSGGKVWALAEDLGRDVDMGLVDFTPPPPTAAPAPPAPAPVAAPPCRQVTVTREVTADIVTESGYVLRDVPIGTVEGRGCTQAEAEANAAQLEAQVRAGR